jgi:hypothetical protein
LLYNCRIFANGWKKRKNNFIRAFHENERLVRGWIVRFGLFFTSCLQQEVRGMGRGAWGKGQGARSKRIAGGGLSLGSLMKFQEKRRDSGKKGYLCSEITKQRISRSADG